MMTQYRQVMQQIQEKALACGRCPQEITLVAVSKSHGIEKLQEAYQEGCRHFGESRVQEAMHKIPCLPKDCVWHLIGTLQSNKVAKAVPLFSYLQAVDHPTLAQKISQISQVRGLTTSILLQVNTSGESTKHGLTGEGWLKALEFVNQLPCLRIEGLMTMAPYSQEEKPIRACFRQLYQLREAWRSQMRSPLCFQHLSMGMSNDYLIAIEEGATILRIGSAIFGSRVNS